MIFTPLFQIMVSTDNTVIDKKDQLKADVNGERIQLQYWFYINKELREESFLSLHAVVGHITFF